MFDLHTLPSLIARDIDYGEHHFPAVPNTVPADVEADPSWKRQWLGAKARLEQGLGDQSEYEQLAIEEVGLLGSGPYGFSHERMAKYLRDEEALGHKYQAKQA